VNLSSRFQWALQGYSQTQFFYGSLGGVFYDPTYAPFISRDLATATRTVRGGSAFGIYPIDRYRRFELSGGLLQLQEEYNDPQVQDLANQYQAQQVAQFGQVVFRNGTLMPLGASFIQETTVFREYGPLSGNTIRAAYDISPKVGTLLSRQTLDVEARNYLRLGENGTLAMRIRGFKSLGDFPDFLYFGGNYDLRGYDYLEFAGSNSVVANAELRFPLIEAALTPIGVIGGIRGVFFAGIGGAWFDNQQSVNPCTGEASGYRLATSRNAVCQVTTGVKTDANGNFVTTIDPVTNTPVPVLNYRAQAVDGFRLQDGRASYGLGLETFALGFPIHFDWSWRTLFNKDWENVVFGCNSIASNGACISGAEEFRKPRFAVWIGYDF